MKQKLICFFLGLLNNKPYSYLTLSKERLSGGGRHWSWQELFGLAAQLQGIGLCL